MNNQPNITEVETVTKDFVTIGDASEILGVSIDTIRRWEKAGKIHSKRLDGKNRFFDVEELNHFLSAQPLSTTEVATILRVSPSTVRRLEDQGLIQSSRDKNGKRQYDKSQIDNYILSKVTSEVSTPISAVDEGNDSIIPLHQVAYSEVAPAPVFNNKPPLSHHVKNTHERAKEHANNLSSYLRHSLPGQIPRSVVYAGAALIGVVLLFATLFLMFPEQMDNNFGYANAEDKKATGSTNPILLPLKPFATAGRTVAGVFTDENGNIQVSNIKNVLTTDEQGNIVPTNGVTVPDTSYIKIPDKNLIDNLNSEYVGGYKPGNQDGNLAVLPITGDKVKDKSLNGVDLSDGTIQLSNLSPALQALINGRGGGGSGATGAQGAVGPAGPQGPQGPQGPSGGGSSLNVQTSDGGSFVSGVSNIQLGPTVNSNDQFTVTNLGSGQTRIQLGSAVLLSSNYATTLDPIYANATETPVAGDISGSYSAGFSVTTNAVSLGTDTTGNYVASITGSTGLDVTGSGGESAGVSVALDITTSGTTSTISSNSGLEVGPDGLRILGGCSSTEILKWNGTAWLCSTDNSSSLSVEENDMQIIASVISIDFLGTDFAVTNSSGEADIAIDYSNSGITRKTQTEVITGGWTFNDSSFTLRDNSDISKNAVFELSAIATGATRIYSVPNVSGTLITTGNMTDITGLGTVTSGVWQGTTVGVQYGGTGINGGTATNGSLLIGNGSGYSLAGLTQGSGITITNGVGSITVAATLGASISNAEIDNDAVAMGTQTTGNYVATVAGSAGIAVSGSGSENAATSLSLDVTTAGTTGTTNSNSGLELGVDGLRLVGGCSNNEILKWNGSAWACAVDANSGSLTTQENDTTVSSAVNTIDFLGADFDVSETPAGEVNVSIDYTNSGITRSNQAATITASWLFTDNAFTIRDNTDTSKQLVFQLGGISTATIRTLTAPDVSGTLITSGNLSDINSVGTVTSGTWNASVIGAQYGGTGINGSSAANGQLLIGNGSGYSLATIGQGNGISVTNGSGSISLGASVQSNKGIEVDGNGLSLIDCSSGEILKYNGSNQWLCATDIGTGTAPTLQDVYANDADGSNAVITLTAADGGVRIRDNATPISANLFSVQNDDATTTYLGVNTAGITTSGTLNGATISGGSLSATAVNGLSVSGGTITVGVWNGTALTDAYVSDTLTASMFVGLGSITTAVDLATAEVSGILADSNVSDTLTSSNFVGSGSATNAVDLATAEVSGNLWATSLQNAGANLGAANVNIDFTNTNGSFVTNLTIDGALTASSIIGALTGNASTATALAANPLDCTASQFANAIAANGDLACVSITDADIPNNITIDLASTATALAANPSDCAANQFATTIASNGNLTCAAITDADVADTLTIGAASTVADGALSVNVTKLGSTIDLATAEVAGNLRATNLQSAGTDLGAANVSIDLSNTNGAFVTNLTVDGTITAVTFSGSLSGNASTATALAANPSDCAANQFATTIAANGNLTCAAITDADVPNNITVDLATLATTATNLVGSGSTTGAVDLSTAEVAGNLRANNLQSAAADLGAADVTINLSNTNGSFNTNLTLDGIITATTFSGALTGNASTATALAVNPTDCGANQFANVIAANGNLTCASLTDADIPNNITIDLAANSSLLGGQAGSYYLDLANATGTLAIARIADASITNAKLANSSISTSFGTNLSGSASVALGGTLSVSISATPTFTSVAATTFTGSLSGNASTATALAANPSDCAANQFATTIAANGNLTCAAITDADVPDTLTIGASSTVADAALSSNVTKLGSTITKDEITGTGTLGFAWSDAEVSDTLTSSLFVGSGSTTTAVDLATAEVAGNLRANNLQSAGADLGAVNINIDLSNTNGAFVTNLTIDGTITAATFIGALTGNASTASALAANPTDCGANQFATTIASNGNLTCASIADADVSDTLTASLFVGSGSTTTAIDLATAEVAGTLGTTNGGTGLNGSTAANGQLLIGNGSGYSLATITQGNGLTVTNGAGSISLAAAVQANKGLEVDGNGLSLIDCASGEVLKYNGSNQWICSTDNGTGSAPTLDDSYGNDANGSNVVINLTSADGAIIIRDNSTPIGGTLFAIQNSAGGSSYFDVTTSGITTGGTINGLTVTSGTITGGTWNGTAITDTYVSDTLTSSLFVGSGSSTNAIDLATGEVAGNLRATNLQSAGADLGAANVSIDLSNTNGAFVTNLTLDGSVTAASFVGALTGNASTASALAANPTDCSANQFATAIVANGDLSCAALTDADIPNTITIDLAATATAFAANPSDCAVNQFANAIAANGNLTCAAINDADVSDTLTASLFVGSGSSTTAVDLATAEVAGNLRATNLQNAGTDLGATNVTIDLSNTNGGGFVTNLTVDGTITAATFVGSLTGNASTATALAANPSDCVANQFANTIAANGNLTCASITDADVSDTLTASLFVGSGSSTSAVDLATAEIAGNLRANNLQSAAADLGAADVTVNLSNNNGSFYTNIITDGTITATTFIGAVTGNASTATALAANPSDCAANQFANAIAGNGNLTCAAITDADVPNNITVDLSATATALATNPTDCAANQFATTIAANGNLSCAAITDADVSDTLTASLFVGSGSSTNAIDLATAEVAGNLRANNLQTVAADLGAADVTINFGNTNGSFNTNLTLDGTITASSFSGALTGNASTATALAANPSDCSANQFATIIAANGNLTCAALTDGDIPNSITIDLAATATALAANPSDCSANQFANAIAANGNLTCAAITDADVSDTLTASLFVGSGSSTTAIDLATAEVAGNLRANNLQGAGADLGAANVNIDLSNSNGAFVTNLTVDGTITAATFVGALTGNASTATALAANPSDCAANQFATTIAANGNLTCAAITDADVPDTLTIGASSTVADAALSSNVTKLGSTITKDEITGTGTLGFAWSDAEVSDTLTSSLFVGSGSTTTAVDLATAEVAGNLRALNLQSVAADLGAADVNVVLSNTNSTFVTNLTLDGTVTAATFVGALTGNVSGNASTATALAADPTDCSGAGSFARGIAANGTAACATIADADIPNNITIDLATTATNLIGSGSTTGAVDLATAEVAGNLRAVNLQSAGADLGAANVNIDFSNTNGAFVTNLTVDGTITAATFAGNLTGNVTGNVSGSAGTATALAADPTDCSGAGSFARGIAANGTAACATIADADVPNNITIDLATNATTAVNLVGSGSTTNAVDLATAEVSGNLRSTNLQASAADLGAADVNIILSNSNSTFVTNLTLDGTVTAATFVGALTGNVSGNASTATALAADPTDCSGAGSFARGIAANGTAACATIADADIPNNITIDLATTATNLIGSGSTTGAVDLATAEVAGNLRAVNLQSAGADLGAANVNIDFSNTNGAFVTNLTVDGTITAATFAGNLTGNVTGNVSGSAGTATALAADPTDCSGAGSFARGIAANGTAACATIADADVPNNITIDLATNATTAANLVGTGSTTGAVDLATAEAAGILPVSKGGTGASTLTDLISLTTHTSGNYLAGLGAVTGLSAGANGEGATPTLAVLYGSTANTAVQGSTTFTCAAGTGNLTGGGNAITMGSGGTCNTIATNNAVSFTTSVTTPLVQNAGVITLGTTATAGSDDIIFTTAGTEKMRVLENGNLSVASSWTIDMNNAAARTLTVTNSGAGVASLSVEGGGSFGANLAVTAGGATITGNSTITGTLSGLTGLTVASGGASITGGLENNSGGITNAGNISGTNSVQSVNNTNLTLDAQGTGNLVFTGYNCTGLANGGALTADAAGQVSCSADDAGVSDVRLKENIQSLNSVLDLMKQINVVTYDFKCNDPEFAELSLTCIHQTGVIAQEIKEVIPDAVYMGDDGYYRVNYRVLDMYTMKAVQELSGMVDELMAIEDRVETLEQKVAALEAGSNATGVTAEEVEILIAEQLEASMQAFTHSTLTVAGSSEFRGDAFFQSLVTFGGTVAFNGQVGFNNSVSFTNNTGGYAAIGAGKQTVRVSFPTPYDQPPVVSVSIGDGKFARYSYQNVTSAGFDIVLETPALETLNFSWLALSVQNPYTYAQ